MSPLPPLPVDAILPEIVDSLRRLPSLVIEAPPGAGKTTRVPPALLGIVSGEVLVLEPRRIAARLAARRVAWELGEKVGETVGYQIRFEEVVGPKTRLKFVTEGVLTRRLLTDPSLDGVSAVVLDEFHERHVDTDLALALLKRLQRRRADLRIVVMSATLEAGPVSRFLDACPILRSEGRTFELSVRHMPYSPKPVETQVRDAVEQITTDRGEGNILVFLPGTAEIRKAMRECETLANRAQLRILPLHGSLSPEEQDVVVSPSSDRKLIMATNVAETSVTIEGVNAVVDLGLARFATYSPWSGLPTLHVGRVSKSSAKQRAGRAGRTGPGRVIRLYSEEDYLRRQDQDTPEILRSDLSQLCLSLRAMGFSNIAELDWLDSPPEIAVKNAELLLDRLGAGGAMAKRLARFPLSPRLARIVVESVDRGVGVRGCFAAALLGSGIRPQGNDLLVAMESCKDQRLMQHVQQLLRIARPARGNKHHDESLLMSVLSGFPDRVARLRSGKQVLLSPGGSAEIEGESPGYEFMVAVDAEDRKDKALPIVRLTARIEPEWLLDLFPDRVKERSDVVWNRTAERVDGTSSLLYDDLVIQESRTVPEKSFATELLAQKAMEAGIERFVDADALASLSARIKFAGFDSPDNAEVLKELCEDLRSFAELRRAAENLIPLLEHKVGARRLNELAPARITLPSGQQTKVHYGNGKPPWIASRIQDFFGMKETPRIGPQRTAVVCHLLAPSQRPVQTTADLAGFWERLYPEVRRELMRRYPKHSWPERP